MDGGGGCPADEGNVSFQLIARRARIIELEIYDIKIHKLRRGIISPLVVVYPDRHPFPSPRFFGKIFQLRSRDLSFDLEIFIVKLLRILKSRGLSNIVNPLNLT